jgi:hypothetical protein
VLFDIPYSFDTYIFKPKVNVDLSKCNFKFGTLGCDNRIAYEIKKAGYIV